MTPRARRGSTGLVIAHGTGVERGVEAARAVLGPDAEITLLSYGRAAQAVPHVAGAEPLAPPRLRPSEVVRWLRRVRRQRFAVGVVSQPFLTTSRARGALRLAPFALGAQSAVAVEHDGQARPIRLPSAVVDAAAFALLLGASHAASRMAELVLRRLAGYWSAHRATLGPIPVAGRVLYLRTDVDLVRQPLTGGGSLSHTNGIIEALRRRGSDVELWTTGDIAGEASTLPRRTLPVLPLGNIPVEVAELGSGILQYWRLRRTVAPAFIYQRYSMNNLLGVLLSRRWHVPLVLEANASEVQWRSEWSSLVFPALGVSCERAILQASDRIAAVSANAAGLLRDMGAVDGALRVVPNGVDVERFACARPAELPWPDAFVVGFAGLFYPWHGVGCLVQAFVALARRLPDARLLLVGDGEEAPRVRSILRDAEVDKLCLHTGLVPFDDVPGHLAACSVLVSPHVRNDRFIGSPIKLWEYMAAGRPIVATRVAQLEEVLENERTALLVDPNDSSVLVDALVRLHDDPALGSRLGVAAQNEARQLHSWDTRLEMTLAAL